MKEIKRITRNDGHTLHIVDRGTSFNPYVVCWNLNDQGWDWGTYCHTIRDAERIFEEKCTEFDFI